jgi:flagellar biosynthesis anti-sigma factor FlgM
MKINEPSVSNTLKPQSSRVFDTSRSDGKAPSSAGSIEDTGDKIDLNSQASLLSQAQAAGASESSAHVERLRALVQSGQYQVDPGALSQSIVNAAVNGY